jgi:hypothetical protein
VDVPGRTQREGCGFTATWHLFPLGKRKILIEARQLFAEFCANSISWDGSGGGK